jgi:hypothetical protein
VDKACAGQEQRGLGWIWSSITKDSGVKVPIIAKGLRWNRDQIMAYLRLLNLRIATKGALTP